MEAQLKERGGGKKYGTILRNRSTEQCTKAEDAIASELGEGGKDLG